MVTPFYRGVPDNFESLSVNMNANQWYEAMVATTYSEGSLINGGLSSGTWQAVTSRVEKNFTSTLYGRDYGNFTETFSPTYCDKTAASLAKRAASQFRNMRNYLLSHGYIRDPQGGGKLIDRREWWGYSLPFEPYLSFIELYNISPTIWDSMDKAFTSSDLSYFQSLNDKTFSYLYNALPDPYAKERFAARIRLNEGTFRYFKQKKHVSPNPMSLYYRRINSPIYSLVLRFVSEDCVHTSTGYNHGNFFQYSAPYDAPSLDQTALNRAIAIMYRSKTHGTGLDSAQLGLQIAMFRKVTDIVDTMIIFAKRIKDYRSTILLAETALSALSASDRTVPGLVLKILANISGYILMWKFCISPLVKLFGDLKDVLESPIGSSNQQIQRFVGSASMTESGTFSDSNDGLDISSDYSYGISYRVVVNATFNQDGDVNAELLHKLGLATPAAILWQICPFSFVVDWLFKVTTFIETFEISYYNSVLNFNSGYVTHKSYQRSSTSFSIYNSNYAGSGSMEDYQHGLSRQLLPSLPRKEAITFDSTLDSSKLMSLVLIFATFLR